MIAAGIVTCNPDLENLKQNYMKYIDDVEMMYICDNASDNIKQLEYMFDRNKKVTVIKNDNNKGIAYALNRIMKKAKEDGIQWVLTMDQDSLCQEKIVSRLIPYCDNSIGIICPHTIEMGGTRNSLQNDNTIQYVDFCITSASLTNVAAWDVVGGFDEWMFIDIVDFEFCARIKEAGYKILQINNVFLYQRIGQLSEIVVGKRHIYVRNHSPLRKYYFSRNLLYCNYLHPTIFRVGQVINLLATTYIKVLLFEKHKFKKVKAMNQGICDGIKKIIKIKNNKRRNGIRKI